MTDAFAPQGELTHRAVTALYRQTLTWRRDDRLPATVDLGGVSRCDSSALALLLEWLSWARARRVGMRFVNPPENLVTIAKLCGVDGVLGFESGGK